MGSVAKVGAICRMCRYLVNRTDYGNLLVCGMHTYGPAEDSSCEDFEQLSPGKPRTSQFLPLQCRPETPATAEVPPSDDWEEIEIPRETCYQEAIDEVHRSITSALRLPESAVYGRSEIQSSRSRFSAMLDFLRSLV